MVSPHGSMVDVVAVVAYIGPTDTRLLHQYGMRKLCLKDTRRYVGSISTKSCELRMLGQMHA